MSNTADQNFNKRQDQPSQISQPFKVLCVCLGNICRSPTAEVILQHHALRAGLNIQVDSAGTSNYHPNKAPDSRSQLHALAHGYDLSRLRARQLQLADFQDFDLILAMDHENYADILKLKAQLDQVNAKVAMMSEHDASYPKQALPDPYYGGADGFERVIAQCESSSRAWVQYWQSQNIG